MEDFDIQAFLVQLDTNGGDRQEALRRLWEQLDSPTVPSDDGAYMRHVIDGWHAWQKDGRYSLLPPRVYRDTQS